MLQPQGMEPCPGCVYGPFQPQNGTYGRVGSTGRIWGQIVNAFLSSSNSHQTRFGCLWMQNSFSSIEIHSFRHDWSGLSTFGGSDWCISGSSQLNCGSFNHLALSFSMSFQTQVSADKSLSCKVTQGIRLGEVSTVLPKTRSRGFGRLQNLTTQNLVLWHLVLSKF